MVALEKKQAVLTPPQDGRRYLVKNHGKKTRAHYWTGSDTVCRMWSTGGLRDKSRYSVTSDDAGLPVCQLCQNQAGGARQNPAGAPEPSRDMNKRVFVWT